MKRISVLALLAVFLVSLIPQSVMAADSNFNYVDAFAKSILFYEANWCGPDAGNNRIKWRGPCHIEDGKDVKLDLTGGFHDCGDHVKFGLPQCASASTLAWAYYEFKDVFIEKGQDGYMLNILKHFTDYFMKCFQNKNTFYYQLGEGEADHAYWGPPELQTYNRPTYYSATSAKPGSDVAGDAAAALALMYLNYQDKDKDYANTCLAYAKDLYTFGMSYRGSSLGQSFYQPKDYYDELMWGAVWLNIATGEKKYMDDIDKLMTEKGMGGDNMYNDHWTQCWDYVMTGVFTKLAQISDKPKYKVIAEEHMDYWQNGLDSTPGGLKYLDSWGVCKYPAAESMVQLIYYKTSGDKKYLDFAKSQIDYILGKNPNNMSYVVGFGDKYPKFPHHRAASGRLEGDPADEKKEMPERHILYGALVGGADKSDNYVDICERYVYTETGLDYNAGLVGAMAGMSKYFGQGQTPLDTPGLEGEPPEYYVEAKLHKDGKQGVEVDAYMYNIITAPPKFETGLSFKYFFDLSEYGSAVNPSSFMISLYYTPNGAKVSSLQPWDKDRNIYYVEVTFPNQKLYAKSYVQFGIYNYSNSNWKSSNDFSTEGLTDTYKRTENIPIYRNGEQISGKDPSGGVPSEKPTPTSTATPTPTATSAPTAPLGFSVSGYAVPDFLASSGASSTVKSGFKVEISGTSLSALTDENGHFEITGVPENTDGYTLGISKPSYLYRELKGIPVTGNVQVSTKSAPITLWAGDMVIKGVQDGAINLSDIVIIGKSFNSSIGSDKYVRSSDINGDGAINMKDIVIIAAHFNKVSADYNK